MLTQKFKEEGISLLTGYKATKVQKKGENVELTCEDKNGNIKTVEAQKILIAVGRKPNVEGLELQKAGVQLGKKGIITDTTMRTTAKNIYAAGDVVGPYLFSHMAWYQAMLATRNAVIPLFKSKVSYKNVIWVTFTAPELASAGLKEDEAREKYGDSIKVYRMPYSELDRAITDRATFGLCKFICDKKGQLLGIHILGARAGEIIHETQLAKTYNMPFYKIFSVIHAYPTYSELLWHASKKAYIHRLESNFFVKLLKRWFIKN